MPEVRIRARPGVEASSLLPPNGPQRTSRVQAVVREQRDDACLDHLHPKRDHSLREVADDTPPAGATVLRYVIAERIDGLPKRAFGVTTRAARRAVSMATRNLTHFGHQKLTHLAACGRTLTARAVAPPPLILCASRVPVNATVPSTADNRRSRFVRPFARTSHDNFGHRAVGCTRRNVVGARR